ncbi:hypothetical protein EXM22_10395 [Oceanispirochaeta crateris]|uniref:Uncharacterized protein n=1 Tax=Oceanispirochaeta crateris TaxID=2518645 RepID=A0A5C1QQH0_9SPIO|nr:hypothetical protein [Oceanispirochaeta crateris]QEN08372.1 hypothetical protein EXM22_10395 [Oceanispirochaeta crateris]
MKGEDTLTQECNHIEEISKYLRYQDGDSAKIIKKEAIKNPGEIKDFCISDSSTSSCGGVML